MNTRERHRVLMPTPTHCQAEGCGKKGELRPYGPGGIWICFACGMKDKPATSAQLQRYIDEIEAAGHMVVIGTGGPPRKGPKLP